MQQVAHGKSKRIKQRAAVYREAGDIENTQRTQIGKDDQADVAGCCGNDYFKSFIVHGAIIAQAYPDEKNKILSPARKQEKLS